MTWTAIICEDEELACRKMERFIATEPRLQLVGIARDGVQAAKLIGQTKPNVVFLDIQMPGLNGFEVLEMLSSLNVEFHTIFTTAFNEHAVKAFECEALDYLLKPFDQERFTKAVDRINKKSSKQAHKLSNFLAKAQQPEHILLKKGNCLEVLSTGQIQYLETQDKYLSIQTTNKSFLHRQTMADFLSTYQNQGFVQTHRRYCVNLNHVAKIQAIGHGDYEVFLSGLKASIPLSRHFVKFFLEQFGVQKD